MEIVTGLSLIVFSALPALAGEPEPRVPRIDQIAYYEQLSAKRPELVKTEDECKDQLALRPVYRRRVLSGRDTFASIEEKEYAPDLQKLDQEWADRQRSFIASIPQAAPPEVRRNPYYPAGSWVGYYSGPEVHFQKQRVGYKIYCEFKDPFRALTPKRYLAFMKAMRRAGFVGDTKIQTGKGIMRYRFNNLLIHAVSVGQAELGEKVAVAFFGKELASVGRGVDLYQPPRACGGGDCDWNMVLCNKLLGSIPAADIAFTLYK